MAVTLKSSQHLQSTYYSKVIKDNYLNAGTKYKFLFQATDLLNKTIKYHKGIKGKP